MLLKRVLHVNAGPVSKEATKTIFPGTWAVSPTDAGCPGAGLSADLRKGPRASKVPVRWVQAVDRRRAGHSGLQRPPPKPPSGLIAPAAHRADSGGPQETGPCPGAQYRPPK